MTGFAVSSPRYAPAEPLPPYGYVPGHDLPHPVNDPAGHLYAHKDQPHEPPISTDVLASLPTEPASRSRALATLLAGNSGWLYALDLFNEGFYWEAHETWESFWNALGRTTPEALFVQGLIHLAAACVKVREGKPNGVGRHAHRARELLGGLDTAHSSNAPAGLPGGHGGSPGDATATLGLDPDSLAAVVGELDKYRPECWHTSRTAVVRVVATPLRLLSTALTCSIAAPGNSKPGKSG